MQLNDLLTDFLQAIDGSNDFKEPKANDRLRRSARVG